MWNFQRSWLLALEFSRDLTQSFFVESPGLELCFVWNSRGKVKKMKNFRDVFKKVCPHIMPNILHWNQFMEKKPVVGMTSYFSPIYGTVFELAQGLQDSRTSDFKCSYGALVQKEAFTICQDRLFTSFFCVLSLSW